MIEVQGNIWDHWNPNRDWIVITTNGDIRHDGLAVMGRGIAFEAAQKFPNLQRELASKLRTAGNSVHVFINYGLITFPTKNHWQENSDLRLIENSCKTLANIFNSLHIQGSVLMPRLGCGNGKLKWGQVRPIVEKYLTSDKFQVFHL